ncbi:hypothetical protein LINPERHAP2_LOCUS39257 [Linum perenne]
MHRSASWTRVPSDDYFMHSTPMMASSGVRVSPTSENNELPMYDPIVEMAKKDKTRHFAERAVHVIPLVLLVCGLILWFFCNPDMEVGLKGDTIGTEVEGLTIQGNHIKDGTQSRFLPINNANSKKPSLRHRKLHEIYI